MPGGIRLASVSPGKTMVRVYDTLKARVMNGEFAPGSRLDPMMLRRDFGSSATPVRDALHRLTGERLIESWRNEGFRIAHVSEAAIRDLYDWTQEVSHVVLRSASRHSGGPPWVREMLDYPGHLRRALAYLAAWSRSPEHAWTVGNLADRSTLLWRAEGELLPNLRLEIEQLETALSTQSWLEASKSIDLLHRRRTKAVAEIAAWVANSRSGTAENVF